jgi:hypothetical protein
MPADPVDDRLQRRLGFTDHALERFGQRAGLDARNRATLEPVLRDLLTQEGRVVAARPRWARSQNPADAYIQVGEWLLLICRHDLRRPGSLTVVTVVNGPAGTTWRRAVDRGLVLTPAPLRLTKPRRPPLRLGETIRTAVRHDGGRAGGPIARIARIAAAVRARRAAVRHEHRESRAAYTALRDDQVERRRRARAEHQRRHG